ncbi:MAG: HAD family phosphatase [Muribaculaceae bacterium]|nr:HAD family phosphatase [Muribaculaceae bacterium]
MNLLFDLGGVIMDIRKENCIAAFERLGLKDAASYFGEFSQQGPFMLLERGDMTVDQFHQALRQNLPAGVTDAQIDDAFCQFLIGIPVHRLHSLEQLRRRYPVYMLSNTNPIMWDSKIRTEFEKDGKYREDYFDGIVTSFEARSLKPEQKIFEYAASKLGIEPAETLFLDDSELNLEAAEDLGFKTALVAPGMEFPEVLAEVLPRINS